MKEKLLTDIELDVQELKCLMNAFSNEPTRTLSELLKRSISQMQGRLDELLQEVDSVEVSHETTVPETQETVVEMPETVVETPETVVEIQETIVETPEVVEPVAKEIEVAEHSEENEEPVIVVEEPVSIEEPVSAVLGERIKLSAGLRHSISLNDSFRFSRELFGGDTELMNRVIEQLSVMSSYNTAVAFLSSKIKVDEENETLNDFLELLRKYFNQSA